MPRPIDNQDWREDGVLDLSGIKLSSEELARRIADPDLQAQLETLYLCDNGLTELPPAIGRLKNLHTLVVERNKLTQLPRELANLQLLVVLCVNENKLSKLPEWISDLKCLQQFIFDSNQLEELPSSLGELQAIRVLQFSQNKLAKLPKSFKKLAVLEHLDLSVNAFNEIPAPVFKLPRLRSFFFEHNRLDALPDEIGELSNLKSLFLRDNDLQILPSSLGSLTKLRNLYLSFNQLASLPETFNLLTELVGLDLANNHFSQLPNGIGELENVKFLNLHRNGLAELPKSITKLKKLRTITLFGNPELEIPKSIQTLKPADVLQFYFSKDEAVHPIREVKVMLVGAGGAGKTSLSRYLTGQKHRPNEPETPGIALQSFELPTKNGPVQVRLWDFAGQEITHALHKFFLTEGAIYILLVEPRSDREMEDARHWLDMLKSCADDSPVLIALNKQDLRKPAGYDIDRFSLQEDYPFIHSFTPTSCGSNPQTGCDELKEKLVEAIESIDQNEPPHLKVSNSWFQVMERCQQEGLKNPRMQFEEFRRICSDIGEPDSTKQEIIARVIGKLGIILHFADEPMLRDTAVLNPHWVTDGVYRLMRCKDIPESDGILTLSDAIETLRQRGKIYPITDATAEARYLLRLMERFEMCFKIDHGSELKCPTIKESWLVPGALSKFQPASIAGQWEDGYRIRIRYIYNDLPEGLIPRFIVRTQLLSEGQVRWRKGVVLQDSNATALIREKNSRQSDFVEVTVVGKEDDRFRLLQIIWDNLEQIHEDLPGDPPSGQVELSDGEFKDISVLEDQEKVGRKLGHRSAEGVQLLDPASELNRISYPESRNERQKPLRAFLSYSHDDIKRKDRFKNNLSVLRKKNLIDTWEDGRIEPGTRWLEQIEENLEKMDVFIGLLTTAFLASDFIEKVELKAARERLRNEGREFRFYLIVVDDISIDEMDLAEYQLIFPEDKAVSKHRSLRAGFDAAQKEIELSLKTMIGHRHEKVIANREDLFSRMRFDP